MLHLQINFGCNRTSPFQKSCVIAGEQGRSYFGELMRKAIKLTTSCAGSNAGFIVGLISSILGDGDLSLSCGRLCFSLSCASCGYKYKHINKCCKCPFKKLLPVGSMHF